MEITIEECTIGNIPIRIVEEHHHVLLAWAELYGTMPYVLSFDHHTDTCKAFRAHISRTTLDSDQLIKDLDPSNQQSLIDAIAKLKHDEHIDAAVKANIINTALIISHDSGRYQKGRVYCLRQGEQYNYERIIINSPTCIYDCDKMPHDDGCVFKKFDNVIESRYLKNTVEIFNDVDPKQDWIQNYILDIDLDCFHTMKSLSPNDTSCFKELIRNAKMITIARESVIVNSYVKYDSTINVENVLDKLLNLINETVI